MAGRDFEPIIVLQVGQLLSACVRRMGPRRPAGVIAKRVSAHASFIEFADGTKINTWRKANHAEMFLDTSTYPQYAKRWPKKSRVPAMQGGMSWHAVGDPKRHWSDARWASYQLHERERHAMEQKKYREALDARGLAHKTWNQIAQALGLDIKVPQWVKNAKAPNGKTWQEGLATKFVDQAVCIVEIVNRNPLVVGKLDGEAILAGALRDREKAFMIDTQKGVFEDLERRAKRYPGVFVN